MCRELKNSGYGEHGNHRCPLAKICACRDLHDLVDQQRAPVEDPPGNDRVEQSAECGNADAMAMVAWLLAHAPMRSASRARQSQSIRRERIARHNAAARRDRGPRHPLENEAE